MAVQQISRFATSGTSDIVFTDSESTTGSFAYAIHGGALLYVSATSTGAAVTLTFGSRPEKGGAFFVAADSSNAPVTLDVEPGRCYQLPDEVFAAPMVSATTPAGATVTCKVAVKG